MRIYLAGPLFSTAETMFNVEFAKYLRDLGHEVFLPQEHEQSKENPRAIFESDVAGIDWAEVIVGNLDGPDPDSGTCWELGYGYAKGKFIVVYRTDFRIFAGSDPINLMMTESAGAVVLDALPTIAVLAKFVHDEIELLVERRLAGDLPGAPVMIRARGVVELGAGGRPMEKTPVYTHSDK